MDASYGLMGSSFALGDEVARYVHNPCFKSRVQGDGFYAQLEEDTCWKMLSKDEALTSLDQMREMPSMENLIYIVKECRKKKNLASAKHLLSHIHANGLEVHTELGNNLVPMLVECGGISDALKVFNRLVHRNVYSWTSLIQGYSECGEFQLALNLFPKMQEDCVDPSGYTFLALLKCCARLRCTRRGRGMHAEIAKEGFDLDPFVGNATVDMYAKCGSLVEAREVFDELLVQDIVSWNALIAGFLEHGLEEEVLSCLEQMQLEEVSPDAVTFVYSLRACGCLAAIDRGRELHAEILKEGFERDTFVGNILVDLYVKCASLVEAWEVFDELPARDVVSWTALISGYAEHGLGEEALNCLEQMLLTGVPLNAFTLACSLKACGSIWAIDKGREVHAHIAKEGFEKDSVIGNALVNMYAKCGSLAESQEVFDEIQVRDVVSWNALIALYTECGFGEEGLSYFEQMQVEGVSCNVITLVSVLKACGIIGAIERGREIHAEVAKEGFEEETFVRNTLVDMYAKCGYLAEAQEMFDELTARDVVPWTALISGYAEHGLGEEVLRCLEQMQQEGVPANNVTFVCSLKACGTAGAIDRGRGIHVEIVKEDFERDPFVGNTLVDMYAKCGSLIEAQEVFDMLLVQSVVSWNALMAGHIECGLCEDALKCLEQMQLDGVSPDVVTFVRSLTACGSIRATNRGRELHAHIAKEMFERDPTIGNSLIDMYAKCGALAEARDVFEDLLVPDVVSWTALIAGYAELELGEEAFNCLEKMLVSGVSCDAVTFVCCLKVCGSIAAINIGQKLHAEVAIERLERDLSVGNMLINMYGKCGLLAEAQEVFDELPDRDVVSWTALISGYAEGGLGEQALMCFEQMQLENVSPNAVTFVCSLKACGALGAVYKGMQIHAEIVGEDLEKDPFVGNSLVDMYSKCGFLIEAHAVLNELAVRDVVSWNALIAGYSEHQLLEDVLECLVHMQLEGVAPNSWTLACSLPAYVSVGATGRVQETHLEIVKKGFENDSFAGNTLVDSYTKCGSLAEACEVFDDLSTRDNVSWTAILSGYVEHGLVKEALICLEQIQLDGISLNTVVLVCSLKACSSIGAIERGREMHSKIVKKGLERDTSVGNALVDLYGKCGSVAELEKAFDDLLVHDVVSWNTLITGYTEWGLGEEAHNCLEDMKLDGISPDVITWNAIIIGYAEQEESEKAFSLYAQMPEQSLSPNRVTFMSILKACGKAGVLETGKRIHAQIYRHNGLETTDINMTTALIDMYFKCGNMVYAQQVFDAMPTKDLVRWNSLIAGYARQGESEFALFLFERMRQEGIQPNRITFLSVLTACSHVGLVEKGQEYFKVISKEYNITPSIKHYNCMVDLLGRAGRFDEAVMMLERMPLQPDVVTWSTLLGACHQWGNVELARQAFDGLVRLDENDASAFTSMLPKWGRYKQGKKTLSEINGLC